MCQSGKHSLHTHTHTHTHHSTRVQLAGVNCMMARFVLPRSDRMARKLSHLSCGRKKSRRVSAHSEAACQEGAGCSC